MQELLTVSKQESIINYFDVYSGCSVLYLHSNFESV